MHIIFCDDNKEILNQLQDYVSEFFISVGGDMPTFCAYTDGEELLANESHADLAFLDVEMPGISGIDVGARLKELNPKIKIFIVTSYPDYLDDAMRFQVFRYLSKPIDKARLFRNLKDAVYQYNMDSEQIVLNSPQGMHVLSSDELVCVESFKRRTKIYTVNGVVDSVEGIEQWQEKLESLPCFYRTYKSYLVNMKYVSEICKDRVILKYGNETISAYVAQRRYKDFKSKYLMFLESTK